MLSKSVSAKSQPAKDLVGRKVAHTFRGHKGLFHGTVRRIFEVKPKNKFPVIYSFFFDEDQTEVRMNSRDVLRILHVVDS